MQTILNFINMLVSGVQQFLEFFIDLPDIISQFIGGILPPELIATLLIVLGIVILVRVLELIP